MSVYDISETGEVVQGPDGNWYTVLKPEPEAYDDCFDPASVSYGSRECVELRSLAAWSQFGDECRAAIGQTLDGIRSAFETFIQAIGKK